MLSFPVHPRYEGWYAPESSVVVARLDEWGNILWLKNVSSPPFGGTLTPRRFSIVEDGEALVVAGATPLYANDPLVIKVSLVDGQEIWSRGYELPSEPRVNVQDIYKTDEGYRFGGWTSNDEGLNKQQFVIDIDENGGVIRSLKIGPSTATSCAFYSTPDQGFIAVQGDYSLGSFLLSKVDPSGTIEWSRRIGVQGGLATVTKVTQGQNDDIIVVGYTDNGNAFLSRTDKHGNTECNDYLESVSVQDLEVYGYDTWYGPSDVVSYVYDYPGLNYGIEVEDYTVCQVEQNNVCVSSTSDFGPTLCGRSEPLFPPVDANTITNCSDSAFFAISIATELYNAYADSLSRNFDSSFRAKCLQAYKYESFTVTHVASEYHYTLYYYDQAGNLVKTVPPQGVDLSRFQDATWSSQVQQARTDNQVLVPVHTLVTQYRYNTLNQVVAQKSPDGGLSKFWYDRLGRLSVSQNAQQQAGGKYSYTLYDPLGRITEVGQKPQSAAMTATISRDAGQFGSWLQGGGPREQINRTVYDVSYFNGDDLLMPQQLTQRHLRNRVSYSQVFDAEPAGGNYVGTHRAATYYSYDIHGNVDTLLQDYNHGVMASGGGNRFKKMAYNYDLISGKVNKVSYQSGKPDQFYHRYEYDADNKLVAVYTSADNLIWEREVKYEYYKHGPLARTILGEQLVQGIDYAYTLQGWLKGVNSASLGATYDMGGDGVVGGGNQWVGRDALGFSLNYFAGEYKPIHATVSPFPAAHTYLGADYRPLFNGNISSMTVNIGKFSQPMLYNYAYDQLNRITKMDAWTGLNESANSWSGLTKSEQYKERVSYDGNGNILTYLRNGDGVRLGMDQLTYGYKPGTNQLDRVTDAAPDVAASEYDKYNDIKQGQVSGNYQYDALGNLISDASEGITGITWTVYGKIGSITKNGSQISYTYDASGNRISKTANGKTTWYVRDASGNVMSVYETGNTALNGGQLTQSEVHLYGSSRLGIFNMSRNVENPVVNSTGIYTFDRGQKFFELSNHLGNVLATISDKKLGVPSSADPTVVDYYEAEVVSAQDYYPFGMGMPGRMYLPGNSYRYGFNGQEISTEADSNGNGYTAEFWQYDARIGRRWNVDPKPNVSLSHYNCFAGNPIWNSDALGDSIAPERNKGMHFIVVPNKEMRDKDIAAHGKKASAYHWDYKKAKKMERKSGGTLKVIEGENATDAVAQIKGSVSSDQYVANITIDFHRSSGPFDDPQFEDGSIKKAFNELADGYIGKGSNVYLGMCWSGGNQTEGYKNLTERSSIWLDGATAYGHQAAASSVSFILAGHFSGPVWEDYGKTPGNLERRRFHTISYFDPAIGKVRSVELKTKVFIQSTGEIHRQNKVNLSSLPNYTPYDGKIKITIPFPPPPTP